MKKSLLFLLLVLMGAMWSSIDARWIIGDRKNATQILKNGTTVVVDAEKGIVYSGDRIN